MSLKVTLTRGLARVAVGKLMELHGEGSSSGGKTTTTTVGEDGEKVDRPDNYEPPVLEEV